jgi:hypothetical protein
MLQPFTYTRPILNPRCLIGHATAYPKDNQRPIILHLSQIVRSTNQWGTRERRFTCRFESNERNTSSTHSLSSLFSFLKRLNKTRKFRNGADSSKRNSVQETLTFSHCVRLCLSRHRCLRYVPLPLPPPTLLRPAAGPSGAAAGRPRSGRPRAAEPPPPPPPVGLWKIQRNIHLVTFPVNLEPTIN